MKFDFWFFHLKRKFFDRGVYGIGINSLLTSNTNNTVFKILNYGKPKFTD